MINFDSQKGLVFDLSECSPEFIQYTFFENPKPLRRELKKLFLSAGIDERTAKKEAKQAVKNIQFQILEHQIETISEKLFERLETFLA